MSNNAIDFKDPALSLKWIDTALKIEKEKFAKIPVERDKFSGHEIAQGWGYVVAGYFLVEQVFKMLLHLTGTQPTKTHNLSSLFDLLSEADKDVLREYYRDFKNSFAGANTFPYPELNDFINNLDGGKNSKGRYVGAFDWRYYLIEEKQGGDMPIVSIEFLHEIVHGVARIIEYHVHGRFEPSKKTYGWRRHTERKRKYWAWLTVRRNSDAWEEQGDRLEIVWGPDYQNRYDYYVFKGEGRQLYFCTIPDGHGFPVKDMREEVNAFDVGEGSRNIGIRKVAPFTQ